MKEFFKEHIDELIEKYANGNITDNESVELLDWAKQDDHKQYFQEQLFIIKSGKKQLSFNENSAFVDLMDRMNPSRRRFFGLRYAAAALIVLLLAFVTFLIFYFNSSEVLTDYVAIDDNLDVTLEDSSRVCVRTGSKITISDKFNTKDCVVELKGQAFFNVTEKHDCQFIVKTGMVSVRVVGTSFDINYDTISGEVRVSLDEGVVEVYLNDSLIKEMIPDEQLMISQEGNIIYQKALTNHNYIAYKTKLLEFDNCLMSEVVQDLSDYYNTLFIIANDEVEQCMLTSRLNNASLNEVKFILEKALNTNVIILDDKIVIHGKGCSKK